MLSAAQDTITISYFLSRWASEFMTPDEVVCDDSSALQKACTLSYTRCKSVADYLNCCFKILDGVDDVVPECYLRLDIAHYIRSWSDDKAFKNADRRLKHYYLCIMGFIAQTDDYNAIKLVIKNALILANYPIYGDSLPTSKAHKHLDALIQTHNPQFIIDADKENGSMNNDNVELEMDLGIEQMKWFDEIIHDIDCDIAERHIEPGLETNPTTNWYYFPRINKFMRHHIFRLPLWSACMRKHFNSKNALGISTDIESRFNIIKNNVFRNQKLPVRADVFVKKLIAEVSAVAKLNRLLCSVDSNNDREGVLASINDELTEQNRQKRRRSEEIIETATNSPNKYESSGSGNSSLNEQVCSKWL